MFIIIVRIESKIIGLIRVRLPRYYREVDRNSILSRETDGFVRRCARCVYILNGIIYYYIVCSIILKGDPFFCSASPRERQLDSTLGDHRICWMTCEVIA